MRTMNMTAKTLSAATAGILLLCAPAFGATHMRSTPTRHYHMDVMPTPTPPVVASTDMTNATLVFLGGTPIMRFRVAASGDSRLNIRADQPGSQRSQQSLLGQGPIYQSDITVEPLGDEAVVLVKGQLLFTADNATAQFNSSTPMELANIWADRMRNVLPGLTAPH